ncbi:NAD(P)-dependent alcohol dehydrogenase [Pseudonocardia sp.]|uniref:NAD(P)-dependent alcohol dehydrogenase n=1 Tax=Pseudonocardia sp. TaxID=60912 RepID=UPI00261F267A|nr:NAD(P)-dependent alcohol dehydrogenase [Pseudonocardia sp.]MCW2721534.1 alcohol dehydrogenase [Pseudonocardia sp.]MDT7617388.1 NAD+-dependent secondary alcohol dehydrogenase Adh1 [Pseudonocardiales bacterium]
MLAVRLEQYGQIPVVADVPEPVLQGADDVIVAVEGAGVCRTDLHAVHGELADVFPTPLPFTLGHEVAGVVVQKGADARGVDIGTKVVLHPLMTCGLCRACRRGEDQHCAEGKFVGLAVDGGMAQFVRTNARALVPLASTTDTREVAPLADAGITAYHALRREVAHLSSESVAVILGCGGLGHLAIQMLRAMSDCVIVAVDPKEAARDLAKSVGADHVAGEDAGEVVAEVSRGAGATAVFDFVGEGDAPALGVSLLGAQGLYSAVGYGGTSSIPTMELVLKELRVQGNMVGTYQDLAELIALYERGLLRSHVVPYPLAEAHRAFDDLEKGLVRGRAVLVP